MTDEEKGRVEGMREQDLLQILTAANRFGVIILIRHTNEQSLQYIGKTDFYPKPVFVKAKTADSSPKDTKVAGLVVHPGIQRDCFGAEKQSKVADAWTDTMKLLDPKMAALSVNPLDPASLAPWGRDRMVQGEGFKNWMWRIDVDPKSARFGCLQLSSNDSEPRFRQTVLPGYKKSVPWSYVHGDYDLKDVVQIGRESENVVNCEYRGSRVVDFVAQLVGLDYETIKQFINDGIGTPMCAHGAEAQWGQGGAEDLITVAYNDWSMEVLPNVKAIDEWYHRLSRKTRIKTEWDGEVADPPKSKRFDAKNRMYKADQHPLMYLAAAQRK